MGKKYLIKHWINVDVIAESTADESEIDIATNNLKEYKNLDNGKFQFVLINDSVKIKRTSYEEIDDEKLNIISQDGISDE